MRLNSLRTSRRRMEILISVRMSSSSAAEIRRWIRRELAKRTKGVEHAYLVYRRTKRYMPADEEELVMAVDDGVEFMELLSPVKLENGRLLCKVRKLGRLRRFRKKRRGGDRRGERDPGRYSYRSGRRESANSIL